MQREDFKFRWSAANIQRYLELQGYPTRVILEMLRSASRDVVIHMPPPPSKKTPTYRGGLDLTSQQRE